MSLGPTGLFLLATLDSAGVPLPGAVDALLLVLATNQPFQAYFAAALAVLGSVVGCIILYYIAQKGESRLFPNFLSSPRGRKLQTWFDHYGMLTIFISAISPIFTPMKGFVILAGIVGAPLRPFILTLVAARTIRYGGMAYLGIQMGEGATAYLKGHAWTIAGILLGLFALLFAAVKWMDYRRSRAMAPPVESSPQS